MGTTVGMSQSLKQGRDHLDGIRDLAYTCVRYWQRPDTKAKGRTLITQETPSVSQA